MRPAVKNYIGCIFFRAPTAELGAHLRTLLKPLHIMVVPYDVEGVWGGGKTLEKNPWWKNPLNPLPRTSR